MEGPYEQVQEVPVSQDEVYATALQEQRVTNIISQISPEHQLIEIEMRIKGYRKDHRKNRWVKIDENAPEPHHLLVSRFMAYLSSILNQNTTLSNLSDLQINRIMKLVIEYIVDDIDTNATTYGIASDYTERTRIGHIILNSVFFVLSRALNGQEARRMWKTLSLTESLDQPQQKKGLLDSLKVWK